MKQLLFVVVLLFIFVGMRASEMTVFTPVDNQAELTNPDMGWTLYQYTNDRGSYGMKVAPNDLLKDWPGMSTVYMRLPWGDVEPQKGNFYWSYFDTPLRKYAQVRKKMALRLTSTEGFARDGTPVWAQAGVKGTRFNYGRGIHENGKRWEPDYGDPVFLKRLGQFLAAAAARYDGNDEVSFIDIGSFGIWGEGHTWLGTSRYFPDKVIKKHIDLYVKNFPNSTLLGNMGFLDRKGAESPAKAGFMKTHYTMSIPKVFEGKRYELRVVLNNPYVGNIKPACAINPDNSCTIGWISFDTKGMPIVDKNKQALLPSSLKAPYAVEFERLEYNAERFKYSARIHVKFHFSKKQMSHITTSLLFVDQNKKVICGIGESKYGEKLIRYMLKKGLGFRDDSIMVSPLAAAYTGAFIYDRFWRNKPVVLEMAHYDHILRSKFWNGGEALYRAVVDAHASQMAVHFWPREFFKQNPDLVRRINLVIGYRYQLKKAAMKITMKGPFIGALTWRNAGVAPCYKELYPTITLKDKNGNLICSFTLESARLDNVMPGKTKEFKFDFPCFEFFHPGTKLDVYISVGTRLGKPLIALPLANPDGSKRYKLGELVIGQE